MPDKDNFGAVLQPTAATEVSDTLVAQNNQTTGFQTDIVATPTAFDRQTQGSYGVGNVASTCAARDFKSATDLVAVPYTKAKRAQSDTDDETWVEGQVNPTLSLFDCGDVRATTVAIQAYSVRKDAKANNFSATPTDVGLTVSALVPGVQSHHAQLFMAQAMTVRRLLPIECERLQGFPDDYTLIPWRKKAAGDCPDGPRYKALGNSMAVNCMEWIGERIAALEAERETT
jgi:site-specific DNA-cytosine methylase